MQSRLADAKKDIVAGKDQVAKTKDKNLQSVSKRLNFIIAINGKSAPGSSSSAEE